MDTQDEGTTKMPKEIARIKVVVIDRKDSEGGGTSDVAKVLSIPEYKQWKLQQFIKEKANPFEKSQVAPTLMPYGPEILRPNPKALIHDLTMNVKDEEIEIELMTETKRRLALGDENILQIPEVKEELLKSFTGIPNIVHFIWFGCHRYRLHHYLSMKSALDIQKPTVILFHTNCAPNGSYWEEFRKRAQGRLRIVNRSPPNQIWGQKVEKVEHQSDVARLQILLEVGGIYMDDDMVILRSLDPFRNNSIVLGEENYDALANSIIMSNRGAWFLRRWFQEYQSFNGTKWSHSSCFVPWSMWLLFPSTVHVVKETMLRPNWEEIKYIYHEVFDWSKNHAMHLYSRFMRVLDGTAERPLKEIAILNTTYGEIARYILWGDKRPRDIREFV